MGFKEKWIRFGVCLFLSVLVFYIYCDVRNFEFVNYDDPAIIYANPTVTAGLTWEGFKTAWTEPIVFEAWYPLTALLHMVDWQWFGPDAGKHHLMNVFFHLADVLLLLWVLHRMSGRFWPSAVVAFLVAVHPLNVEVVAWASQLKTLLAMFFYLGSIWFYVRYCEQPNRRHYLLMLLLYFCGLLAKPLLITMPFILLLFDFWPMRRWSNDSKHHPRAFTLLIPSLERRNLEIKRLLFLEKTPFFLLTILFSAITYHYALASGNIDGDQIVPVLIRVWNALQSYTVYLRQTLMPTDLAVLYPWKSDFSPWYLACCLLFLSTLSLLALSQWKKHPSLFVGWYWYLGVLVPVIGLVDSGARAHADRYAYASLIGIFIAIVWIGASLAKTRSIKIMISILVFLCVLAFARISKRQVVVWENNFTLYQHAIDIGYPSSVVYNNLGSAYVDLRQLERAKEEYQKALVLEENYDEALNNLGAILVVQKKPQEAITYLERALRLRPRFPEGLFNMGNAHHRLKQYEKAIEYYDQALASRPLYPQVYHNRGVSLMELKRYDEALAAYRKAIEQYPKLPDFQYAAGNTLRESGGGDDATASYRGESQFVTNSLDAYNQIAGMLYLLKRYEEAIPYYEKAIKLKPDSAVFLSNYGACLNETKRFEESLKALDAAIQIQPNLIAAHNNRANTLASLDRSSEAIQEYQKVLQTVPKDLEILFNLGITWMDLSNWKEALNVFNQILTLKPDHPSAKFNLGVVYIKMGKKSEGLQVLRSVVQAASDKASAAGKVGRELYERRIYEESILFLNEFLTYHPDHPLALNQSAWILACAPEKSVRNGPEALRRAQKSCSLFTVPSAAVLDTLAAAWAENGKFNEALTVANQALATAEANKEESLIREIKERIALYRSQRAYRETPSWPKKR